MPAKAVWSFQINGKEETQIHGKSLRAEIAKCAINAGKIGGVKNIKGEPIIEVYLVAETADEVKEFIEKLKQNGKFNEFKFSDSSAIIREQRKTEGNFNGFQILREDELTEMVWALQGAGAVFSDSTKQQEELVKQTQKLLNFMGRRDNERAYGRLFALSQELQNLSSNLERAQFGGVNANKEIRDILHYLCLRESCTIPPISSKSFIIAASGLLFALEDKELHSLLIMTSRSTETKKEIQKKIDELSNLIKNELLSLTEDLKKYSEEGV